MEPRFSGEILLRDRRPNQAKQLAQRILARENQPEGSAGQHILCASPGRACQIAGKRSLLEEAIELGTRAAQSMPSVAAYRADLSEMLLRAGRPEEAKRLAQRIVARETDPTVRQRASELLQQIAIQ